ncbi:hypothetical protein [Desulfocicer vacuolatum]|nr:hypothetical protein [Desulfocicer vacuolatum]
MKYAGNQERISSFVAGRAGSAYGLPMAVITIAFRSMDGKIFVRRFHVE